jgi:hypothetical protein
MEDIAERKLDEAGKIESLQHTMRAPSKAQQSSQTYSTQEETFKDEDKEAVERQKTIKKILDEEDAKWKEERRRKIMGKYADAKSEEEIQKIQKKEDKKIARSKFYECIPIIATNC